MRNERLRDVNKCIYVAGALPRREDGSGAGKDQKLSQLPPQSAFAVSLADARHPVYSSGI